MCKYCENVYNDSLLESGSGYVKIDGNDLCFNFDDESSFASDRKPINYCPMCGNSLRNMPKHYMIANRDNDQIVCEFYADYEQAAIDMLKQELKEYDRDCESVSLDLIEINPVNRGTRKVHLDIGSM